MLWDDLVLYSCPLPSSFAQILLLSLSSPFSLLAVCVFVFRISNYPESSYGTDQARFVVARIRMFDCRLENSTRVLEEGRMGVLKVSWQMKDHNGHKEVNNENPRRLN